MSTTYALVHTAGGKLHLADVADVFAPVCGARYRKASQTGIVAGLHDAPAACPRCRLLAPLEAAELVSAAVEQGELAQAEAYVRHSFYPPLPVEYGRLAVIAVGFCNRGEPDRLVAIPAGVPVTPRAERVELGVPVVPAVELVHALRLGHLIDVDSEDQ